MNMTTRVLLAASITVALAACTKKTDVVEDTSTPTPPAVTQPADDGRYSPSDLDSDSCLRQRTVYFDFDQDTLRPEFQAIMACHAKYLNDQTGSRVTLEGNADERGTREYNLALGQRRANSARDVLVASGVNGARVTTISYGKDRPAALGSDESAWAQNRRAVTVVQ